MTAEVTQRPSAVGGAAPAPRRLLLVSHCILNQNAVVQPLARSSGVLRGAVEWALDEGFELYQLPCPEFRFAGPHRAPATFDDYNTDAFHESNARLLGSVMKQLQRYRAAGYEIVGGLHVQGSPACDPDTGNWITDVLDAAAAAGIEIHELWQVPQTATGAFDPDDPQTSFGDPAGRRHFPEGAASLTPTQVARRDRQRVDLTNGPSIPLRLEVGDA